MRTKISCLYLDDSLQWFFRSRTAHLFSSYPWQSDNWLKIIMYMGNSSDDVVLLPIAEECAVDILETLAGLSWGCRLVITLENKQVIDAKVNSDSFADNYWLAEEIIK